MPNPHATITNPAYTQRAAARSAPADDPLSDLISQGISVGNSILSAVLPPEATTSSTPTHTRTPSRGATTSADTSSSTPQAAEITSPSAAHTNIPLAADPDKTHKGDSQSSDGFNEQTVIILAAVIGTLVIILAGLFIWFCIRKRKKAKQYNESDDGSSLESSKRPQFFMFRRNKSIERQEVRQHDIPAPPVELLDTSRKRTSFPYWSPDDVSSSNTPFLTPPSHPDSSQGTAANGDGTTSETNNTIVSPITPDESTAQSFPPACAEIDGMSVPRVPRRSSRRSRVHYPSSAEMADFNFGFNKQQHNHALNNKRPASYLIPRRPVGKTPTRFST